jgi:hypothetical protein
MTKSQIHRRQHLHFCYKLSDCHHRGLQEYADTEGICHNFIENGTHPSIERSIPEQCGQRRETCIYGEQYEMVSESSWTIIVVTAPVKEDERGGQGHTSASLFDQSAT